MKKNVKSILAIIGIVLLAAMYISALVFSFIGSEFAKSMLSASIYCTIVVPIFIFAFTFVYKKLKGKGVNEDK